MVTKCFLVLIIFLFLPINVYALGLSPASIDIDFQPNLKQDIDFLVINSDNFSFPVRVGVGGELAEYIDFDEQIVTLEPFETRAFRLRLELPDSLNRPGTHTAEISVTQTELTAERGGGATIGALVSVSAPIRVFVPFEGPYLEAEFWAEDREAGDEVPFYILIKSLGIEPVNNLSGTIDVYNFDGINVGNVGFEDSLRLDEEKEVVVLWNSTDNSAGFYTAHLRVDYADNSYETDTDFRLGTYFIDILKLQKYVEEGKISEYDATLLSTWNSPIGDIYAELEINYGGARTFKSESFDLDAWQNKTIRLFVDARGMEKGSYPARFSVFYGNSSNSVDFDIDVVTKSNIMFYIAGAIIIILIILLIVFKKKVFRKRGKR